MGKGDQRSKKGKINRGTYGKSRARKAQKFVAAPVVEEKKMKVEVTAETVNPEVKAEKKKTTRKKPVKKEAGKEKSSLKN